jgi:hypothetical protein
LQHDGYGIICDVARVSKIHTAVVLEGKTLPVGVIRYNPDAFSVDGVRQKVPKRDREERLLGVIRGWRFGKPGSLEIQYMYYEGDGVAGLDIWKDPLYDLVMQDCCRQPIWD